MPAQADTSRRSPMQDGRLRLETERQRAEALLRAARDGEPEAVARIARRFPGAAADAVDPAQAEAVIAGEAGFESWAALTAHVEALDAAAQAARGGDGDMATLHLRCGGDIQAGLQQAGLTGEFLEFSDPYCMGPVPALPTVELIRRQPFDGCYIRPIAFYGYNSLGLSPANCPKRPKTPNPTTAPPCSEFAGAGEAAPA